MGIQRLAELNSGQARLANTGIQAVGARSLGVYAYKGWLEGAWMSKHNGIYYLQYACPGTEFASYSDGVYTSRSPLGPFAYAPNNPFSTRLTGFAHSAGHSVTFQAKAGNWWHVGNSLIGDKARFERRLALYPAGFDADGLSAQP